MPVRHLLRPFIFAFACALTVPALADDAPVPAPAPKRAAPAKPIPKPAAPAANPAPAVPGAAQPTVPGAEAGQPAGPKVLKTENTPFDYWRLSCTYLSAPAGAKRCAAELPVYREDKGRRLKVLEVAATRDDAGQVRLVVQIPTSTVVADGATLTLKGGEPRKFAIQSCEPALCTGFVPFDPAFLGQLQAVDGATVSWTSLAAGAVKIEFPVKGAKDAIAALVR